MDLGTARDIAIIALAVESLFITIVLVVATFLLYQLSRQVQSDLQPLIQSATRTAQQMEETTKFMSETVVTPVIKVGSFAAGVKRGINSLSGMRMRRKG